MSIPILLLILTPSVNLLHRPCLHPRAGRVEAVASERSPACSTAGENKMYPTESRTEPNIRMGRTLFVPPLPVAYHGHRSTTQCFVSLECSHTSALRLRRVQKESSVARNWVLAQEQHRSKRSIKTTKLVSHQCWMHPERSTSKSGQDPCAAVLSRVGIEGNIVRKVLLSLNGAIQSSTTNG
jgi:hypothetical protein